MFESRLLAFFFYFLRLLGYPSWIMNLPNPINFSYFFCSSSACFISWIKRNLIVVLLYLENSRFQQLIFRSVTTHQKINNNNSILFEISYWISTKITLSLRSLFTSVSIRKSIDLSENGFSLWIRTNKTKTLSSYDRYWDECLLDEELKIS